MEIESIRAALFHYSGFFTANRSGQGR